MPEQDQPTSGSVGRSSQGFLTHALSNVGLYVSTHAFTPGKM